MTLIQSTNVLPIPHVSLELHVACNYNAYVKEISRVLILPLLSPTAGTWQTTATLSLWSGVATLAVSLLPKAASTGSPTNSLGQYLHGLHAFHIEKVHLK